LLLLLLSPLSLPWPPLQQARSPLLSLLLLLLLLLLPPMLLLLPLLP
jgi:hypothetical protein